VQVRDKSRTPDTALIVNPNSSSGLTGKNWDELYEKMEKFLETVSRLLSASDRAMGQPLLETCCVKDLARSLPSEVTGQ